MSSTVSINADNSALRPRSRRLALTTGYCISFVALGLTTASLGPTLPALAAQTHARMGLIGLLLTARSSGFLLASLRGGRFYDLRAGHPLLAAALVVMAALMALAPMPTNLWLLALIMFALGAAEGLLDVGGNTLLTWTHDQKGIGPALNAVHLCYAVGATLAPIIVARTITHGVGLAYWTLALLILPAAALLICLSSPAPRVAKHDEAHAPTRPQLILLFALFFALY